MANENKILLDAFKLPPADAIKYLESKGYQITFDWHDMMQKAHTKAFTVAGVIKADVLKDIHGSLVKSAKEGYSFSQFKADIVPTLIKKGWYGKQTITRPDDSTKEVDLSAPWRLKTIFRVNMATSMNAGRYKSMIDAGEARPYWRYIAIMDGRVRDEHAKLNGKIFHYQDPFWQHHYPPNGWNCRCRVDSISKAEFNRKGYELDRGDDPANQIKIDPEWFYNPALEEWQPDYGDYPPDIAQKLKETLDKAPQPQPMPDTPAPDEAPPELGIQDNNFTLVDEIADTTYENKINLLKEYEKQIADLNHEEAFVITEQGQVYNVVGQESNVDISILGKESLKGAYVTHNHTASNTQFSLSKEDLNEFVALELGILRGIDFKYTYELSRHRASDDDEELEKLLKLSSIEADEEMVIYAQMMQRAKRLGLSLKRYKK